MRRPWLSLVLGAACLISVFFVGTLDENAYHALTAQQQAQYTRSAVAGSWIGFGISLAVVILGLRVRDQCGSGYRKGRAQGCLGAVLASLASVLWLLGALFAPYEF